MSVEEAAELARRAIYHATFRDGASGGVASGILSYLSQVSEYIYKKKDISHLIWFYVCLYFTFNELTFESVYHVGPNGWKKLSGDDVGELHYKYYPVMPSTVEQEMVEVAGA